MRTREKLAIKKRTIKHWKRMIKAAEGFVVSFPGKYPAPFLMRDTIGEDWFSKYCDYCSIYKGVCRLCPLASTLPISVECCEGRWWSAACASNWKEWVIKAKEVLKYIEEKG